MTKAVFVHDHLFYQSENGKVFTSGKLPYGVWERYLRFFDKLVVIGRRIGSLGDCVCKGYQESSGAGVDFVFAPNVAKVASRRKSLRTASEIISAELRTADVVISRTSELGRLAAHCALKLNKPYVAEVVGCSWDAYRSYGSLVGRFYAPLAFYRQKRMVENAPFAVYVTQRWLQTRYPCGGYSVGISDVEIARPPREVFATRLSRYVVGAPEPVVLGTNASLNSKYKGLRTAFRAIAALKREFPACTFEYRILGSGDSRPWQDLAERYRISDTVRFCGVVPSGEPVNRWLDGVDIYLQPSDTEGLPRALVEAMSRGCPCIASAVGGIPELLPKEALHRRGNWRELATLIRRAITAESWLVSAAKHNFSKSGEYETDRLEKERDKFWASVVAEVEKRKAYSASAC